MSRDDVGILDEFVDKSGRNFRISINHCYGLVRALIFTPCHLVDINMILAEKRSNLTNDTRDIMVLDDKKNSFRSDIKELFIHRNDSWLFAKHNGTAQANFLIIFGDNCQRYKTGQIIKLARGLLDKFNASFFGNNMRIDKVDCTFRICLKKANQCATANRFCWILENSGL